MGLEIILKLLLAVVLGGVIGLERELHQKDAGLHSCILITAGSALLTAISMALVETLQIAEPVVMVAAVIIAVGLICTGIITSARFRHQGIIAAAVTMLAAAVGIAAGAGYYLISLITAVFVTLLLTGLNYVTIFIENQNRFHATSPLLCDRQISDEADSRLP